MAVLLAIACCLLFLSDLAISTVCALWPIQNRLHKLQHLRGWQQLYSVGTSNLDVWVQTVLHCLLLFLCLVWGMRLGQRSLRPNTDKRCRRVKQAAVVLCGLCEVRQAQPLREQRVLPSRVVAMLPGSACN